MRCASLDSRSTRSTNILRPWPSIRRYRVSIRTILQRTTTWPSFTRRLGDKTKAAYEAERFADEKDDPTANTYALEFLRNHTELANESVPWHAHELEPVKTPAASDHVAGAGNR